MTRDREIYKDSRGSAVNLENSIYFANFRANVGRTRDEINLRSFLGIKSGVSGKFGSQPERVLECGQIHVQMCPPIPRVTREARYYEIFNLSFAPLYITRC